MPNLIQQTPYPRTVPQLPYSRWASLVDADVATWSPTWIVARNSYRPAPLGRIARATHSRIGDAIGPEVMSEPIPPYSTWVSINDGLVAAQSPSWIVGRNSYRPQPLGRIARATHSIRGDVIGPEVMAEPIPPYSTWQSIIDADVAQRFISPIYQERSSFKSLERRRIDKRSAFGDLNPGPSIIDQPSNVPWQKYEVDNAVAFDTSVVTPTYYVADFMARAADRIDVRGVNQPDTDWVWAKNDDVIAQTIVPLLQAKYISPERRKTFVSFVNEPDNSPWIWLENDNFIASVLPGILQPLKFRTPDPQSIDTRAIVEPYSIPWIWRVSDDVIATIAPNLWVPKYLARDRDRVDVREISEPEFGWIIVPLAPPYVPLDPQLWPAIEQQLNAIRTRSRNELNVITINVPGFGWVTGYIPAVVIATGSHEKRKWRRSG